MGALRAVMATVLVAMTAAVVGSAVAHGAFDPTYEARNFSKTTERATRLTLLPDYKAGPPPEALPECRDTIPPVSRFTRSKSRLTRRAITLRGTSRDAGCDDQEGELRRVKVSVARQAGRLCRFLRVR